MARNRHQPNTSLVEAQYVQLTNSIALCKGSIYHMTGLDVNRLKLKMGGLYVIELVIFESLSLILCITIPRVLTAILGQVI